MSAGVVISLVGLDWKWSTSKHTHVVLAGSGSWGPLLLLLLATWASLQDSLQQHMSCLPTEKMSETSGESERDCFCNPTPKATSQHFCQILFLRRKPLRSGPQSRGGGCTEAWARQRCKSRRGTRRRKRKEKNRSKNGGRVRGSRPGPG